MTFYRIIIVRVVRKVSMDSNSCKANILAVTRSSNSDFGFLNWSLLGLKKYIKNENTKTTVVTILESMQIRCNCKMNHFLF